MEEIKQSLNFMSEEIAKVAKQQTRLLGLMEEVCELKKLVLEKDKKFVCWRDEWMSWNNIREWMMRL